jgi:hypothetical protein
MAAQYCDDLLTVISFIPEPPPLPGAVPRDPDDDKIIACALATGISSAAIATCSRSAPTPASPSSRLSRSCGSCSDLDALSRSAATDESR